jgi:SpoVK/Ycf46/Vps4 family AAA+-type ATPase
MLASTERIVVLLDEFDELVQDRDQSDAESSSRFLTTAMLPKIAELADRRRIVYLLATNHIERFDDAISRAGRFDLVIPVLPPSLEAKWNHWPAVEETLERIYTGTLPESVRATLDDLTFLEFRQFADQAAQFADADAANLKIADLVKTATMLKPLSAGEPLDSWKARIKNQSSRNRLHHA